MRTWEAALHLGSFLATPAGSMFISNKRVLDLGAGTGFLSVLCAKHFGAARVTATDGDPGVIESLNENVALNELDGTNRIRSEVFKWGQTLLGTGNEEKMSEHPHDVVLGADLVLTTIFSRPFSLVADCGIETYDMEVVPLLVSSICNLISKSPSVDVIIAGTVRKEETIDTFTSGCSMFTYSIF